MRPTRSLPLLLTAFWLAACRPYPPAATSGAPDPRPGALVSSLNIEATHDSVRFTLALTNAASTPVTLEFPSSQRYDFAVRDGDRVLWHWSADRSFAQVVGNETLAPGETRSYSEVWRPGPDAIGRTLTGVGKLTTVGGEVERTAQFTVP